MLNLFRIFVSRRVARIWKRGGLFWKSEKCAYDVDSNFHWPWISFRRFVRNLRRNVSETSEIQRFFPPKIRWSPKKKKKKKKKGLRQNSEWFFGRNPKFKGFFRPKLGNLQKKKKKKRSSPKFRVIFRPKSEIQRFFPPKISWSPKTKKTKKKKKRSSPKFRVIFLPSFASSNVWGGALFVWGGYFPFFTENRAPPAPPPGYATVRFVQ